MHKACLIGMFTGKAPDAATYVLLLRIIFLLFLSPDSALPDRYGTLIGQKNSNSLPACRLQKCFAMK